MKNIFSLASGITNRVGENKFFLTLDYDGFQKEEFQEKVEHEIRLLINTFHLSDATVYSTHSWFHVYFFNDNKFTRDQIISILKEAKNVDEDFKKTFEDFSKQWKWATLRLNGKYKKRDIYFFTEIKWRKPDYIETSIWKSLKMLVEDQIAQPLVSNSDYEYDIDSKEPGNEKKTALPVQKNKEQMEEKPQAIEEQKVAIEKEDYTGKKNTDKTEKISPEELFPKNRDITKERELWYRWANKNIVARLISASLDKREGSFIKNRDVSTALYIINNFVSYEKDTGTFICKNPRTWKIESRKDMNEEVKKNILQVLEKHSGNKVDIDNFIERRPFFMNNTLVSNLMLKSYDYTTEKSWILDTPLHFFKSVATLDTDNAVLSEKIKSSSMYNFPSQRDVRNFLADNKLDLIDTFDLVYDFDTHNAESTESYDNCKKMRDLFQKMQIPFSLNFSGSKWFHIKIPGRILKEVTPELFVFIKKWEYNIKRVFEWLKKFAQRNDIVIDDGVYSWDVRCLIRVEWSIHQATGSVVKPLSDKEFDSLQGKTLLQIQEMYKPSNLIKGNKALWVTKFNPQKKDVLVKIPINDTYMSWEDLRDAKYDEIEWKGARDDVQNPIAKELRSIANEDPKEFNRILDFGFYNDYMVEAPEYINLSTGRNFDYCRQGNNEKLKEFVQELLSNE